MTEREKAVMEMADKLMKELAKQGKVLEGGWRAFLLLNEIRKDKLPSSEMNLRDAYYGGAQHLFSSIMNCLTPGLEAEDADLSLMDSIHKELNQWVNEMKAQKGNN